MPNIELKREVSVRIFQSPEELSNINRELATMPNEDRQAIIHGVQMDTIMKYPTMANKETYLALTSEQQRKEDFSIQIEGEVIDSEHYIIKAGGFSDRYRESVRKNADMNHWRSFWTKVSIAETQGIEYPDMDFNVEHIHWYAFHYLPSDKTMDYLRSIRLRLLINKDSYLPQMVEHVDKEVKRMLDTLKDIMS